MRIIVLSLIALVSAVIGLFWMGISHLFGAPDSLVILGYFLISAFLFKKISSVVE